MTMLAEPPPSVPTIDLIVRRAGALYTLPAVAVEVLRLTAHPKADVRALKECLQQDPALTAKVLRVVNSSLFGLSHSVGDLNEAVALLGIKQLKLLALGFSLPEQLFLDIASEQLDWYWSTTLARAVAAREVSEQLFKRSGDEAFLAGLMQDLGVLVLLRELGAPYAQLVAESFETQADLRELEQTALGFDSRQLTAGLLAHWKMPDELVRGVAEPRCVKRLARSRDEHAPLTRVLHLAELLAQLVGQHRLSVLPDLLEAGRLYCEMTKSRLNDLVAGLEPKVRQLAGVLSLEAARSPHYAQVLSQAHEAMARVAESIAGPVEARGLDADATPQAERKTQPPTGTVSLNEVHAAVARFLNQPAPAEPPAPAPAQSPRRSWTREELPPPVSPSGPSATASLPFNHNHLADFEVQLTLALGQCRAERQPLSVVMAEVHPSEPLTAEQAKILERVLEAACRGGAVQGALASAPSPGRRVLVLVGRDRQEAVAAARGIVERLLHMTGPLSRGGQLAPCVAAAGVASIAEPAKNFQGARLLETADRCLAAAITSGGVKSLEVI
ncbi:MAG TPA: HDOD domain-containing protein [Lacipirellulaceae bacterium]|nr:HDOD domain-containing protein [Lacipirellulaceae bacterium]